MIFNIGAKYGYQTHMSPNTINLIKKTYLKMSLLRSLNNLERGITHSSYNS